MTQIKVEAVTKEPRSYKGALNWGVKLPGDGGWVTLYREKRPERGEVIDVNITERRGNNGQSYKDCFPVMPALAPDPVKTEPTVKAEEMWSNNTGKKVSWDDTREFIKAAHKLALVLEPDERSSLPEGEGPCLTDRSTARAAITNTLVIAYTSGKIFVPKDEDEYIPPADDDIPPF